MKRRRSRTPVKLRPKTQHWLARRRSDRSEAGDTLVEILISLTVVGVAGLAIMTAFATAISGSGEHRNLVTFNTVMQTASAELNAAVQQQPTTSFASCSAANTVSTNVQSGTQNLNLPTGYSANISGVQYWTSTGWTPSAPQAPSTSCPPGASSVAAVSGLQRLTITVSTKGHQSTTTAVSSNPVTPSNGGNCNGPSQLVWVSQPGSGLAGQALFPAPTLVVEDSSGTPCRSDAASVTLAISAGTGTAGASLTGCSPSLGYGETTFQNCSINTPGNNYTLTATDASDHLTSVPSVPFSISAGTPVKLVFHQSPSNGTGGVAFPTQPVVYVEDAANNLVAGDSSTVTLAIGTNGGNGTLSGCSSATVNGVATFSGCKIDKAGTGYTLTATDVADNLTTPSSPSNTFNITPGPATQLIFVTSPQTTVVNDPLGPQPVVAVEDAGGNTTTINMGTVTLGIGTNAGGTGATLSGCTQASSGGIVTFSNCAINKTGNGYTLLATDGSLTPATSNPFNVAAAALTSFSVTPSTTTPTAGTAFSVTIKALDQSGFTFPGLTGTQTIAFSGPSSSPNGTAPLYPATVSFTNGVGTASVTLNDAQTTKLTATQGLVTGTSGTITVGALTTASTFTVVNPGNQVAGTAFNVTIDAADTYGNTVTGYAGNKTVTFSGPANSPNNTAPSYPGIVNFTNGVGQPSIKLYDAQTTTLTAKVGTSPTGTSTSFTVSAIAASTFTVTNPGAQTAGTAFQVTVTAVDSYGNQVSGYSGSQALTFSGPANSPNNTAPSYPGTVTFNNGVGQASVTLYDAQTTTLTATQGGASGTSGSFTVSGTGHIGSFVVANPGTQTAGSSFGLSITAGDPYGNKVTGYTGAQTIAFSGPSNAPGGQAPSYPASVTFTNGSGTATMTLYDAQSTTITATQGPAAGTSPQFTVNGATAASRFTVANPGNQTVGTAFNVTITAFDQWGNTATGYTGAKTVTFSGPSNSPSGQAPTYPASVTFASGVGTASVTLYDVQSTSLTATQGLATGNSGTFSVGPAGPKTFSVSNPGTQTAGTAFNVTITAVDQWGNTAVGYTGQQTLTFSGPANSPSGQAPSYPASVTFTNGVGTASVTLYDAQSTSLTVSQSLVTGSTGAFTVNGTGTASAFTLSTPSPTAGTAFNETVTAVDQYGNTVSGYSGTKTVTFSGPSSSPSGQAPAYPANVTFTNGAGTASITLYDAQTVVLVGTQGLLTGSTTITVAPAAASKFTVSNPGSQTAGTAFNVTLSAFDQYGNAATGYSGSKAVTFSGPASAPSGQAPTYPATVTFTGGVGTASITLYDAQSTTLTATQGTVTGTSTSFTVVGTGANSFSVSNPGTVTAGSSFNVTLTALDTYGNSAPGYSGSKTVTFSGASNSPNGHAPTYPASVTFTSGVGTASVTLFDAQSVTLRATQGTITGTTTFTVGAAGAVSFSVPTPGTQAAGSAFNVTITAFDTYGNQAIGYTGSQALTFSGPSNAPSGQAPTYPGSVTFTGGVGTASITLYDAQSTTLTATQSLLTGSTGAFTVTGSATAGRFTLSNPGTQTAGTSFNVTITAFDQWGNTASGYTGAKTVAFSGPASSPSGQAPTYPASVTFANGVGTASVTLYDAQSTTLTATQGTATGTSTSFSVGQGATNSFNLSNPGAQTAGTAFNVTITAVDQWGNTATSYTGVKTVTFTGPATSPNGHAPTYPASVTFASGVGTASITLFDAQTTSVTATQGSLSGATGNFAVSPTSATAFNVPNPGTQTAGSAFNETITAVDTYGNTATSYSGSKSMTFTGPSSSPNNTGPSYPASVTFTNGVGTASITLFDAQSTAITATQGTLTGGTGTFTVSPAAANSFTVPTPATQTAGSAFNETLTALDNWGNTATSFTGPQAITFSGPANSPNGHAPTYPASVTFTNGVGTASITLFDAQSTTLTATQNSVSGTSGSFTVNGLATTTTFVLSTPSPTAGSAFTETITAGDTYGNKTTSYTGAKTVAFSGPANSPSGQAPSYPASVTFSAGVGTAVITLYDAQSTTLTAKVGTTPAGTSASFTVNPAVATKYSVANPGAQTAGSAFNLNITALDAYNNTATTYTGSQTLTFTGPSSSPNNTGPTYPSTVSFTGGVGTASIKLYDAQSTSITVTQGSLTGNSGTFTVSPAGANAFTVSTPATQTAGTAFNETLTALDQYGNTATGYTGAQTITFSGPSNAPDGTAPVYPGSVTFSAGVGTASVTLYNASTTTAVTATQGTTSGTSGTFTVKAAAQASLYLTNITTQPTPAVSCTGPVGNLTTCTSTPESNASQTLTAGLQLVDTYGNPTTNTGGSITINLAKGGNSSTLNPTSLTVANGQSTTSAQFTLTRGAGNGNRSASMTASIGGTNELTVTLQS